MLNYKKILTGIVFAASKWPRHYKKVLLVAADFLLIPFALWASLSLRLGSPFSEIFDYPRFYILVPLITIPVFMRLGLYRAVIRYVNWVAIRQILIGVVISSAIVMVVTLYDWPNGLPRSMFAIYGFISFALIGGVRILVRSVLTGSLLQNQGQSIAIYGAGASGRQLASMLRAGNEYRPVIFIDDSRELENHEVEGLHVYRSDVSTLRSQIEKWNITAIFLAMPSVSRSIKRRILQKLESLPYPVFTIPGLEEIVSGRASLNQIREVAIEDLLGRDPVAPQSELLSFCISGYSILVSGAGGSIGSELCRQIITHKPQCLVLYDNSEFSLYKIEQELISLLIEQGISTKLIPVLGSVCDSGRVEKIIRDFSIEVIYHAAAYKHVPLVENNPFAGIANNVFGTKVMADAAVRLHVRYFIYISTDKAVRPTNIMGASKRLGEMVLQAHTDRNCETLFSMVRFGNVLGSSGSVVPQFRAQISSGGPVTVTHRDINRFFMTVTEAVELVIQAGAMTKGGDVFVLDMGEPVKISELARQMIHLSGLEIKDKHNPDGDIEVVFSGLRPGEKLYEELLIGDNVTPTAHPKILRAEEDCLAYEALDEILTKLKMASDSDDITTLRRLLQSVVSGYTPYSGEPVSTNSTPA